MGRTAGRPQGLADSWEWLEFAARLPANPQSLASLTANTLVYSGRCILTGGYFQNTGGGSGSINVIDGADATGVLLAAIPLTAGQSSPLSLPNSGVLCELGVFVQITTATIKGSVFIIPLFHYPFTGPGE